MIRIFPNEAIIIRLIVALLLDYPERRTSGKVNFSMGDYLFAYDSRLSEGRRCRKE